MIDIALLRTNPRLVRHIVAQRGVDVDVDGLVRVAEELRQAISQATAVRTRARRLAMTGQTDEALVEQARVATAEVRALQVRHDELFARLPNVLPDDTPEGADENDNVELRRDGDPIPADETRAHQMVGSDLGILDLDRAADVAAPGFSYWRGDGARLVWAVLNHAQAVLTERGVIPMVVPHLAKEKVFFGAGRLPLHADELHRVQDSDLALISAAEQPLLGYYDNQIVDAAELPVRVFACAPYARAADRDAGSSDAGYAVEQVVLCRPEDADHWLDECQRIAEDVLRDLELPYRVVRACLGDLGPVAYRRYDTQCWFPGSGAYRSTHSSTYFADYQARRLKIRYLQQGRVAQPHTLSATVVTDRAVLAILENHLQPDGSVRIPVALRPYLGGQEKIG